MSNIRAKFVRGEEVKYISHLDLMKVFERAIRRARIPIAYSKGFNPHPHMVFGLPLSVGVTSEAEYADFELEKVMEPSSFTEILNSHLPRGLKVVKASAREAKENIMSTIQAASYDVLVDMGEKYKDSFINKGIEEFLSQPSIMVKKKSKKGMRDLDIKPMIHELNASRLTTSSNPWLQAYARNQAGHGLTGIEEAGTIFSMLVSAGSSMNLKPDLLVGALIDSLQLEAQVLKIHRTGLFVNKEGRVFDPLDSIILKSL